jgi:type I restriction enzyme M protein
MLDSITKKRIDDIRNILVGKIPSPQSQVEQITTGLIYKFMYDMDQEAVDMGGVPSFFVNDYEKYSWQNLFDPKLSGVQKVQLYSDAIEHMYTNPTAPQLFREIFKNSFLPFKDPATLNMFLKEINEFHYSHSEKLGDAFEYLLSFMGSQGDAGQFRTPRHIIDFIVDIVSPQKNENILDPACGTAGFLISSYKHIINQNTNKKLGDKLTASDRKRIGENLVGYDISPDMTRISLVNMYLHQFASPQIHEYDTLSSEDRWNEYYDVILANPPFFSPTGGIQPHSRFGVQSTRAEVLFVDYIIEHLKPNGRSGIIIPEGIIFQSGTAYKSLRKKLIEDSLIGVISLPAGVFQPYSGVKTSILILDKNISNKIDSIFFEKIENDGFSLGTNRTPIDKNDLPSFLDKFVAFKHGDYSALESVNKEEILSNEDLSLNISSYKVDATINTEYPMVKLGDSNYFEICSGGTPTSTEKAYWDGNVSWITLVDLPQSNFITKIYSSERTITESGLQNSSAKILPTNSVVVSTRATIGRVGINKIPLATNQGFKNIIIKNEDIVSVEYLAYMMTKLKETMESLASGGTFKEISKSNFEKLSIPLPPIEVQREIVRELNDCQLIIDGCSQVIKKYKPYFDIDASWEMSKLGDIATFKYGLNESASESGTHRFVRITDINQFGLLCSDEKKYVSVPENNNEYLLSKEDILMARTGATYGKCLYFEGDEQSVFAGYLIKISLNEKVLPKFFWIFSQSSNFDLQKKKLVTGGGQPQFNANTIEKIIVPIPPINEQIRIINDVVEQQKIIFGNNQLINLYTNRIHTKINKIWGDKLL